MRILRLSLSVDSSNLYDDKQKIWDRLYQIINDSWKSANHIATGQYMNDNFIRHVYARKQIDPKNIEQVTEIENLIFSKDGFFETKRQATTERDIKEVFPNIPPSVTNPLNQIVYASYIKEKKDMLMGNRSLRSYKQNMPIPIRLNSMNFNKNFQFIWNLQRNETITFNIYFGKDRANYKSTIAKILNNEISTTASSIQLKDKKLYLLLGVKDPINKIKLDPNKAIGVDCGITIPAFCATNFNDDKLPIGNIESFANVRVQMQCRYKRIQKSVIMAKSQHGRKRKTKALETLREKERNFAQSYNHMISKKVVDFAIKNSASKIIMEKLSFDKNFASTLRNWSYFELQSMIKYKAKKFGIEFQQIPSAYTSTTCSKCGHNDKNNRIEQSMFQCVKCGYKENADYNAAKNIACFAK